MAVRGINKVILVGRLGKDPEVRYIPNGGAVANLQVATSESWRDKQTGEMREQTEWHRVVLFGKLAEVAGEYVDCVALDAALLEKLQAVAEYLREAEGWGWCAGRMEAVGECREDARAYRNLPQPEAVLTEAEEERLNELMARYDALENQCEESDLLEAEMKLMRCMAKVRAWTPEMRAGSGVVVCAPHPQTDTTERTDNLADAA